MRACGIDLGVRPAIVVLGGDSSKPELLEVVTFHAWESAAIIYALERILAAYDLHNIWCEQTFSHGTKRKAFLRDIGRRQENQAGFLEGALWGKAEVRRVPPVTNSDAYAAWQALGAPEEWAGGPGEHVRDGIGVSLKGMIREEEEAKGVLLEASA